MTLLLVACSSQVSHDDVIKFAVAQAPLNLDPRYATDAASERVNRLVYQSLVDFDASSKPVPSLASWVQVTPQEYCFSLNKQRASFHNQQLLTANDVKATYDSFASLKNFPHAAEFANIAAIVVVNEDTIIFQLKQSDLHFPEKLIIGILPAELIKIDHDFAHAPVGNGPLQFISWKNKLVLQRVKDQQIIELIEVKDPTVRVLKLLRGEVDLLQGNLPQELLKYLQSKPELKVISNIGSNFSYLGFNFQDVQLKHLKVRQAVAHAIDRQAIIDKAMVADSRAATSILPPEHYTSQIKLTLYDYNPALAKQLLMEAGVKLPLKLIYKTSTDAQRVRLATIMQAQMAAAGIDLEIRSLDWGTFFDDVKHGKFQLYGLTWVGLNTPEIYSKAFGSNSFPPNGFNRGRFADAELDNLLTKEDWPAATQRIHTQLPYIPLWYEGEFAAMRSDIKNYTPKPNGNWDNLTVIARSATITHAH